VNLLTPWGLSVQACPTLQGFALCDFLAKDEDAAAPRHCYRERSVTNPLGHGWHVGAGG
jgi:hypothetical protein